MSAKIQALIGTQPETFEYGNTFVREHVGGRERLKIGLNGTQDRCVRIKPLRQSDVQFDDAG